MPFTNSTNNFGPTKWSVNSQAGLGTHTTLATAMTAASSGDTIILETSVTENVTITPGVNIVGLASGSANLPSITGTLTMTGAGTSTISGLELITNSAAIIAITGSAASILNVNNCYLNFTNNTGITFSTSGATAALNIYKCTGDIGTTGIGIFTSTATATITFEYTQITNSGGSTTQSSTSAGAIFFIYSDLNSPFVSTSTGGITANYTFFGAGNNATSLTLGGSGAHNFFLCKINGGTSSAISIGATASFYECTIMSSNTNAITGAGTINYSGIAFSGSSVKINTTTQVGGLLQGGVAQAPSTGFIGEQLTATTTGVSLSTGAAKTIASISVTAGIWDICGMIDLAGTITGTQFLGGISTTNNTLNFNFGSDTTSLPVPPTAASDIGLTIMPQRATLTSTTIYYLVARGTFTVGTLTGAGKISATRVG
jgi:hypothetical protein